MNANDLHTPLRHVKTPILTLQVAGTQIMASIPAARCITATASDARETAAALLAAARAADDCGDLAQIIADTLTGGHLSGAIRATASQILAAGYTPPATP